MWPEGERSEGRPDIPDIPEKKSFPKIPDRNPAWEIRQVTGVVLRATCYQRARGRRMKSMAFPAGRAGRVVKGAMYRVWCLEPAAYVS